MKRLDREPGNIIQPDNRGSASGNEDRVFGYFLGYNHRNDFIPGDMIRTPDLDQPSTPQGVDHVSQVTQAEKLLPKTRKTPK